MKYEKKVTFQPRKKRKALVQGKIHSGKRLLHVHLGKDMRLRYKKRALLAKKGDKVRIISGDHRKREGKITEVDTKEGRLYIEGIIQKKQGGKEVFSPIDPSNCILLEWVEPKRKQKKSRARNVQAQTNHKITAAQPPKAQALEAQKTSDVKAQKSVAPKLPIVGGSQSQKPA